MLVTLQGGHTYVGPSWYEFSGVPPWNYQAVNVEGVAQNFTDSEKLEHVLDTSTKANESAYKNPWEPDYATSMLSGIVGIEIVITSIQCKLKLSQNHSAQG